MKSRTMILLDAALRAKVDRVARERGVSLARLVAEALEAHVGRPPARSDDPLFHSPKIRGRGPRDGARRHDRYTGTRSTP